VKKFILIAFLLMNSVSAFADNFKEGMSALSKKDYSLAVSKFILASNAGDDRAQLFLGQMYLEGTGVLQNFEEAARFFTLSALKGNPHSQNALGSMYFKGIGFKEDHVLAKKWYGLSASQGNDDSQFNLGLLYESGLGVLQNYELAHMWFNLASVKGNAEAFKQRELVARKMVPSQIAQAQKLALQCAAQKFRNCD
jgi:TPR repeat protein